MEVFKRYLYAASLHNTIQDVKFEERRLHHWISPKRFKKKARKTFQKMHEVLKKAVDSHALIIRRSYDRLIGENTARQMLEGIPNVKEVVLGRTGHMFRFSHPVTYAQTIEKCIRERVENKVKSEY